VNLTGAVPVVDAAPYSGAAAKQRQRRLARVRLAELVALRRAARSSSKTQSAVVPAQAGPAE
jgi:hypothetical protein